MLYIDLLFNESNKYLIPYHLARFLAFRSGVFYIDKELRLGALS